MKSLTVITSLVAMLIATGCQSPIQPSRGYADLANSQIKSTDAISKSLQSLELSVTQNKKESEDRIAQLEKDAALREQDLSNALTRINTANQKYENLVAALAGAASKTFTGTDIGSSAVSAFFNTIEGNINSTAASQTIATDAKVAEAKATATAAAQTAKTQAVDEVKNQLPLFASQSGFGSDKIQQLQNKTDQLSTKTTTDTTGLIGGAIAAVLGGGALARQNASLKTKQDLHEAKLKQVDDHDNQLAEIDKRLALHESKLPRG